jgi:hypothetical protein
MIGQEQEQPTRGRGRSKGCSATSMIAYLTGLHLRGTKRPLQDWQGKLPEIDEDSSLFRCC